MVKFPVTFVPALLYTYALIFDMLNPFGSVIFKSTVPEKL